MAGPLTLPPGAETRRFILPRIQGAAYAALGRRAPITSWDADLPSSLSMVGPERRPVPPALHPISDGDRRLHRKVVLGKVGSLPLGRNPNLDIRCLSQGKRISESVMDLFFGRLSDWIARNPDWAILRSDMFAHLRHSSPPPKGACTRLERSSAQRTMSCSPAALMITGSW